MSGCAQSSSLCGGQPPDPVDDSFPAAPASTADAFPAAPPNYGCASMLLAYPGMPLAAQDGANLLA